MMENNIKVELNNLLEKELEEIKNTGIKLREIEEVNELDTNSINTQIASLIKLKAQIQTEMFALNSRVEASELDVGFE